MSQFAHHRYHEQHSDCTAGNNQGEINHTGTEKGGSMQMGSCVFFKEQMRLSEKGDDEAMIIDKDFVRALEYGMPPTSGMGIGMDRLTMLMTAQSTIQEV